MGSIELELSLPAAWHSVPTVEAESLKFPHRWGNALSGVDAKQVLCEGDDSLPEAESNMSGSGEKEEERYPVLESKCIVAIPSFLPPPTSPVLRLGE